MSMLTNLPSSPRVRWASDEYSGSALARLPILPSLRPGSHALAFTLALPEVSYENVNRYRVCRLCGHRLGGPQARRVSAGGRLEQARARACCPHRPEAIAQWAEGLRQRFGGRPIAVCLEIAKGPLVYALQRYAFLVLFPVNPTTLAKYRETFCVSGAKDDPSDAQLALELLVTHPEKLTRLNPERGPVRVLQQLVEQRRTLVDDVRRITNRITDALKQYFPQVLDWFEDKDTLVFCDFLTHWPTLKQAQRARKARLSAFFREHNVRYPHVIERRIQAILAATALTCDDAVIAPNRLLVETLVQQLRVLLQAVAALRPRDRRARPHAARLRRVRLLPRGRAGVRPAPAGRLRRAA